MSGTAVFGYAESDSEDELPAGWEERTTLDGKVYYANHSERTTQWTHPRTGKRKRLEGDLPPGWTRSFLDDGTVVFVNHAEKKTTFTDPRLAFAVEEAGRNRSRDAPRQKYDASTKAMQILHGLDLEGQVVLITGANSGIGWETVRCLAIHNAHVFMACRNVRAAENAKEKILSQKASCMIDIIECDLASLQSVKRCAQNFLAKNLPLHILILNAAVFASVYEKTSDTQLEETFAVNHLGHFYLTKLLSEKLLESAPARVVVVSSESHRQAKLFSNLTGDAGGLTLETLSPSTASKYWWMHSYNMSKLCNVWFALEFNRRFYARKITCNALHPGNMIFTGLSRQSCLMKTLFLLVRPFTKSLEQGASTTVFCAVAPDLQGIGGQYLNNCWFCEPDKIAMDEKFQKQLWILSEEIVEAFENSEQVKSF